MELKKMKSRHFLKRDRGTIYHILVIEFLIILENHLRIYWVRVMPTKTGLVKPMRVFTVKTLNKYSMGPLKAWNLSLNGILLWMMLAAIDASRPLDYQLFKNSKESVRIQKCLHF